MKMHHGWILYSSSMKAKFFLHALLVSAAVLIAGPKAVLADLPADRIPDDRRPATKDFYTYCMSHRDYQIDIYELNSHSFTSDLEGTGIPVKVVPSCNFSRRLNEKDIRGIVIHYTNGSSQGAFSWWQTQYPGTSAHYIINRDGSIIQSVPEIYTAYHLGCYWSDEFCARCPDALCSNRGYFYDPIETTIAIELENAGPLIESDDQFTDIFNSPIPESSEIFVYDGDDPRYHASRYYEVFQEEQLSSLKALIGSIEERHGPLIVLGHSDIQQISVDPGPAFPRAKFFTEN